MMRVVIKCSENDDQDDVLARLTKQITTMLYRNYSLNFLSTKRQIFIQYVSNRWYISKDISIGWIDIHVPTYVYEPVHLLSLILTYN